MTISSVPRAKVLRRAGLLAIAIMLVAAVIYLLVWYGPDLIARHDVGPVTGPSRAGQLQQARDAARGRLLTLGAGLFAAAALVYTALNFRLSREGQVTDRYTKAIEQLGSDKLDVRIGGIYALERVARDSAKDHPTVMEVLAAFIREHSLEPWFVPKSNDVPATRPDMQAALTVIARREATHDRQPIDLHGADLPQAMLVDANLAGVIFTDADLTRAHLARSNLTGADLTRAILHIADLTSADLRSAYVEMAKLDTADLTGADLTRAKLAVAQLPSANLKDANFTSADLRRTNFIGAYNFNSADFTGADFTDAPWSKETPAPEGWVRDPISRRLRRADAGAEGLST